MTVPERSEARCRQFAGTRGAKLLRLAALALNRRNEERAAALLELVAERFDDPVQVFFDEHGYGVQVICRQR